MNDLILRIDKDTDIDGSEEPEYPIDIVGIFAQYDETSPYTDGYQILPRSLEDLKDTVVSVGQDELAEIDFRLYQNYPNPFNPSTKIKFSIPAKVKSAEGGQTKVTLKVFDVLGNEIAVLIDENKSPGSYEVEFSGAGLSSGIYFYRIQAEGFIATKKMMVLK